MLHSLFFRNTLFYLRLFDRIREGSAYVPEVYKQIEKRKKELFKLEQGHKKIMADVAVEMSIIEMQAKLWTTWVLLFHESDPQSQPVVITIFARVVCPSVRPLFKISQNQVQVRIVITTGGTVGLARWIIADTHVLCFILSLRSRISHNMTCFSQNTINKIIWKWLNYKSSKISYCSFICHW